MNNIFNLPQIDSFNPGDKLIIQRDKTFYLIDYTSVYITQSQINFSLDVESNYDNSVILIQDYNSAISDVLATSLNSSLNILNSFSVTQTTVTGSENTGTYRDLIAIADPYDGDNIPVLINDADIERIGFSAEEVSDACSQTTASFGNGSIFLPIGTYRISAKITLSPEIDSIQSAAETVISASAAFRKLTPPVSNVLEGTSAATIAQYGASITLNINGFIFNRSPAEFAMTVSTTGRLSPGVTTGIVSANMLTRSSINKKFKSKKYRQALLFIEKISDNNTLGL